MADLNPLIKVRKHNVDQKQKFLAELYRQAEELQVQKQTLLDQLKREKETAKDLGPESNREVAAGYPDRQLYVVEARSVEYPVVTVVQGPVSSVEALE